MPCHRFQGNMKTYFYKIFMLLVGKKARKLLPAKGLFPPAISLLPSILVPWDGTQGLTHA